MSTTALAGYLSGWCGSGSHDRCRGTYAGVECGCPHHSEPEPEPVTVRRLQLPRADAPLVRRACRRLLAVWPVHEQVAPGTVRYADLVTSTWDARAALVLALGQTVDET